MALISPRCTASRAVLATTTIASPTITLLAILFLFGFTACSWIYADLRLPFTSLLLPKPQAVQFAGHAGRVLPGVSGRIPSGAHQRLMICGFRPRFLLASQNGFNE